MKITYLCIKIGTISIKKTIIFYLLNMKKILFLVVATIMATMSAYAQAGYDDTKHEVSGSLGALSTSQWLDVYEDVFFVASTAGNISIDDGSYVGPVSLEYFYHAKKWLGVGGIFVLGANLQDINYNHNEKQEKLGELLNTYFTFMPAVKFDWLRKKNFGMYSKLAFGATLRTESDDLDDSNHKKSESEVHVNWQVSAIGIEVGSPYVRGFLELGAGEQGTALIGLRCKF